MCEYFVVWTDLFLVHTVVQFWIVFHNQHSENIANTYAWVSSVERMACVCSSLSGQPWLLAGWRAWLRTRRQCPRRSLRSRPSAETASPRSWSTHSRPAPQWTLQQNWYTHTLSLTSASVFEAMERLPWSWLILLNHGYNHGTLAQDHGKSWYMERWPRS